MLCNLDHQRAGTMKALLITPQSQSVEQVDINDPGDIEELIGFDTIESDAVGEGGDCIFFDEECFLRGTSGRFQVDTLVPISGKAVVVGSPDEGATLSDVSMSADELRDRIKYL
jgi:hypothetical protein